MEIKLIVIGKTTFDYLKKGEEEYQKRLKRYIRYSEEVIPELKKAKGLSEEQVRQKEGELILHRLVAGDWLVLLDDKGKQRTSVENAQWLQKRMNSGVKTLVFVVGGAYGFSESVYQRANEKQSLSQMTFTHQMIRLIFKEQLYRAFTILNNEPYHHE